MEKFDLKKVIDKYNLDPTSVASALFPHVQYKKVALNRVLKGEAQLNVEQLTTLAKLAGVLVSDLFTLDNWKSCTQDGHLTFVQGEYTAILNYNGVYLTVFRNKQPIYEELVLKNMSISEFINYLNQIINGQA